jgi:hypothetical protein
MTESGSVGKTLIKHNKIDAQTDAQTNKNCLD